MIIYQTLSLLCALAGIATLIATLSGRIATGHSFPLALDFWMAAGLLKLTSSVSWHLILISGAIIVVRKVTTLSIGGYFEKH